MRKTRTQLWLQASGQEHQFLLFLLLPCNPLPVVSSSVPFCRAGIPHKGVVSSGSGNKPEFRAFIYFSALAATRKFTNSGQEHFQFCYGAFEKSQDKE